MTMLTSPLEGRNWQPKTSGNNLVWDGSAVVKNYGNRLVNYYREQALLTRLAQLPLARLATGSRPGQLRLKYIDGLAGDALVEAGMAANLLREMGRFLRRLHEVGKETVSDILPGDGSVIVHGDYAHYNCLMNDDGTILLAVLDWEVAYLGSPITDLAWCEWQFRNRFPRHEWAISNLFEGYGETPDWNLRQAAFQERLEQLQGDEK